MTTRRGVTLIELIVAIAIVAFVAGLVGLRIPEPATHHTDTRQSLLFDARHRSLREGRQLVVHGSDSAGRWSAIALPDGSIVADSALHIQRFTGRPR